MVPDMDTVFCLKRETGKPEENPLMHRQLRGDFFVCHVIGAQKCDLLFPSRRLMHEKRLSNVSLPEYKVLWPNRK